MPPVKRRELCIYRTHAVFEARVDNRTVISRCAAFERCGTTGYRPAYLRLLMASCMKKYVAFDNESGIIDRDKAGDGIHGWDPARPEYRRSD